MGDPKLSIAVCTYNRRDFLVRCLQHLANQETDHLYEVLVIDNQSTDDTAEVCADFRAQYPTILFNYCLETQQGLSYARNQAIAQARGTYLSYLDDDAYAHSNYVQELCTYLDHHPDVMGLGGKIMPQYQQQAPNWMSKYLLPLVAGLDMGNAPKAFTKRKFPIGANMAFRKSVLQELGGFNPDLGRKGTFLGSGEEKDLFLRMKKQNLSIHYVPTVQVAHYIPVFRTQASYIQQMAHGIGASEALRLKDAPLSARISKMGSELFKVAATLILALVYTVKGQWPKAKMLLNFRKWVLTSYLKG